MVDIGFGDAPVLGTELLTGPPLLAFAGLEPAQVPALPLEQHIAEKLHAYSRTYAAGQSTRVKDLVDLVLMRTMRSYAAGMLRRALQATFSSRATHELPTALNPPPRDWNVSYARMAKEIAINPDAAEGFRLVADFLNPVLNGSTLDTAKWDPELGEWRV